MTISTLGTVGTLSLIILFFILAQLSERFGAVVKMRPLYLYYYLSLALACIAFMTHIINANTNVDAPVWYTQPWFLVVAYHLPLAIAVTIAAYITWSYWSWLVTEHND